MVIRTIETNLIRQYSIARRVGSVGPMAHTPQDPHTRRGRRTSISTLSVKEQIQKDELASLQRLQCDITLMNGDLDHDIAILNLVA